MCKDGILLATSVETASCGRRLDKAAQAWTAVKPALDQLLRTISDYLEKHQRQDLTA